MASIKKLTKHGNRLALVLGRSVPGLLGIDRETPLEISTDGQVLIFSPVRGDERGEGFERARISAQSKIRACSVKIGKVNRRQGISALNTART